MLHGKQALLCWQQFEGLGSRVLRVEVVRRLFGLGFGFRFRFKGLGLHGL